MWPRAKPFQQLLKAAAPSLGPVRHGRVRLKGIRCACIPPRCPGRPGISVPRIDFSPGLEESLRASAFIHLLDSCSRSQTLVGATSYNSLHRIWPGIPETASSRPQEPSDQAPTHQQAKRPHHPRVAGRLTVSSQHGAGLKSDRLRLIGQGQQFRGNEVDSEG